MGFAATLLDINSTVPCQAIVAVASTFDQMARLCVEQFLLSTIHRGFPMAMSTYWAQAVIFARFVLGGVFVAIQRPDFKPVCVNTNILFPLGIATTGTDAFLCCMFIYKLATMPVRKHPMMEIVLAFSVWTAVRTRILSFMAQG